MTLSRKASDKNLTVVRACCDAIKDRECPKEGLEEHFFQAIKAAGNNIAMIELICDALNAISSEKKPSIIAHLNKTYAKERKIKQFLEKNIISADAGFITNLRKYYGEFTADKLINIYQQYFSPPVGSVDVDGVMVSLTEKITELASTISEDEDLYNMLLSAYDPTNKLNEIKTVILNAVCNRGQFRLESLYSAVSRFPFLLETLARHPGVDKRHLSLALAVDIDNDVEVINYIKNILSDRSVLTKPISASPRLLSNVAAAAALNEFSGAAEEENLVEDIPFIPTLMRDELFDAFIQHAIPSDHTLSFEEVFSRYAVRPFDKKSGDSSRNVITKRMPEGLGSEFNGCWATQVAEIKRFEEEQRLSFPLSDRSATPTQKVIVELARRMTDYAEPLIRTLKKRLVDTSEKMHSQIKDYARGYVFNLLSHVTELRTKQQPEHQQSEYMRKLAIFHILIRDILYDRQPPCDINPDPYGTYVQLVINKFTTSAEKKWSIEPGMFQTYIDIVGEAAEVAVLADIKRHELDRSSIDVFCKFQCNCYPLFQELKNEAQTVILNKWQQYVAVHTDAQHPGTKQIAFIAENVNAVCEFLRAPNDSLKVVRDAKKEAVTLVIAFIKSVKLPNIMMNEDFKLTLAQTVRDAVNHIHPDDQKHLNELLQGNFPMLVNASKSKSRIGAQISAVVDSAVGAAAAAANSPVFDRRAARYSRTISSTAIKQEIGSAVPLPANQVAWHTPENFERLCDSEGSEQATSRLVAIMQNHGDVLTIDELLILYTECYPKMLFAKKITHQFEQLINNKLENYFGQRYGNMISHCLQLSMVNCKQQSKINSMELVCQEASRSNDVIQTALIRTMLFYYRKEANADAKHAMIQVLNRHFNTHTDVVETLAQHEPAPIRHNIVIPDEVSSIELIQQATTLEDLYWIWQDRLLTETPSTIASLEQKIQEKLVTFLLTEQASLSAKQLESYIGIFGCLGERAFSQACVLALQQYTDNTELMWVFTCQPMFTDNAAWVVVRDTALVYGARLATHAAIMPAQPLLVNEKPTSHVKFLQAWYEAVMATPLTEHETLENVLTACNKATLNQAMLSVIFSNMQQESDQTFFAQWNDMVASLRTLKLDFSAPLTDKALREALPVLSPLFEAFLRPLDIVLSNWNNVAQPISQAGINLKHRYASAMVEYTIMSQDTLPTQDKLHYKRFYQVVLNALCRPNASYESYFEQLCQTYSNPQEYSKWVKTLIPLDIAIFSSMVEEAILIGTKNNGHLLNREALENIQLNVLPLFKTQRITLRMNELLYDLIAKQFQPASAEIATAAAPVSPSMLSRASHAGVFARRPLPPTPVKKAAAVSSAPKPATKETFG